MNLNPFFDILFGFAIAVLAVDLVAEYRIAATVLSVAVMVAVIARRHLVKRREKTLAFEKTIETYLARHEYS